MRSALAVRPWILLGNARMELRSGVPCGGETGVKVHVQHGLGSSVHFGLGMGSCPAPVLGLTAGAESWVKPDDIKSYRTRI